jgi:hypothetical protein
MRAAALKLRQPQTGPAHLRKLECRVCKLVRSDEHECTTTTATAATLRARLRAIAAMQAKCKCKAQKEGKHQRLFGYMHAQRRTVDQSRAVYHSHSLLYQLMMISLLHLQQQRDHTLQPLQQQQYQQQHCHYQYHHYLHHQYMIHKHMNCSP